MVCRRPNIVIFLCLSVIGWTDACLTEVNYEENCVRPFWEWYRQGIIVQQVCDPELSPDSRAANMAVYGCILTQTTSVPSCGYRNQTVETIFNALFPVDNSLNLNCEINLDPVCEPITGCFYDSFDYSNTDNLVIGFYNFFCGPDYLQTGYSCLRPNTCPYSSAKAQESISFVANERSINLADLREPMQTTCSKLTDADKSCLTTNEALISNCGGTPTISTFQSDPRLTCNVTESSSTCVSDICSEDVLNLLLGGFGGLTCNRIVSCPELIEDGIVWQQATAGRTLNVSCPSTETTGSISRKCMSDGSWGAIVNTCKLTEEAIQQRLDKLNSLFDTTTPKTLAELSDVLTNVDEIIDTGQLLPDKDTLENVLRLQDTIVDQLEDLGDSETTEKVVDTFVKSINTMVKPEFSDVWKDLGSDETSVVTPAVVLDISEKYVDVVQNRKCDTLDSSGFEKTEEYVYVAVNKYTGNIRFPPVELEQADGKIDLKSDSVIIPEQTIRNKGVSGPVCAGGTLFNTLGQYLENEETALGRSEDDGDDDDADIDDDNDARLVVNSNIISLNFKDVGRSDLDPPITINISIKNAKYTNPMCAFWDFNATTSDRRQRGAWSTKGCKFLAREKNNVICECNHLTNFCVLMSPNSLATAQALNIISAVGCGISIVSLILTIICHVVVWRLVRSDRAKILMNLCLALLFALIVFIVGIERVESRVACAAIAAIIQFLFLAVFFLMFLMGIEILICVVHVFGTKFRIKVLLPLTWGAAATIVGVSLGVTKAEGYGNDRFCWLETGTGLIWAFIGPAVFVIAVNFITMAVVFKKMASSNILKSKSAKVKALTAGKSLCVLLPLMGITWVFGLLAINDDSIIMAYLFCIVNSLQGLFIFLFHCVFNRQIQDAWKHRQNRKRSLETFSSDWRNKSKEEQKGKDGAENSDGKSNSPPKDRRKSSLKPDDWMKAERKQYHKITRKGNIYK